MKFWVIKVGEPLPLSANSNIVMRAGSLAKALTERHHDVTWWTGAFDHFTKTHFVKTDSIVERDCGTLRLLSSPGYRRHISYARWRDHQLVARKFALQARLLPKPALVFCALPTLELAAAAVAYGREQDVPVVLDIRDWHPDIVLYSVPRFLRPLGRLALSREFRRVASTCAGATALCGITREFVEWGLRYANRPWGTLDRVFPLASEMRSQSEEGRSQALAFWQAWQITPDDGWHNVVFFGTFGQSLDMATPIEAARLLNVRQKRVRFVLCGRGDRLEACRRQAKDLPNVVFPGWVGEREIASLMTMALAGLDPLPERPDFLATINNKAIQYLSAGVPVVASPARGTLARFLEQYACGVCYENGDPASLVSQVERLVDEGGLRRSLSAAAAAIAEDLFSPKRVYAEMALYAEEVAGSRRVARESGQ